MGIFRRSRPEPENRAATLGALQQILDRGGMTAAGVAVDADKALTNSAVWACLELVAGVGSSLPLDEFRKVADDQVSVSLSSVFADPDPDPSVTAVGWRAQVLRSVVARGNAYAELLGAEMGTPSGAVTIHPDRVHWRYEDSQWQVYVDNKRRDRWPFGDLWHFALFQQPGSPIGLNPVEYHRLTIGASLAAQNFGAQFFAAGGHPVVVIKAPGDPGPEEAAAVKRRIVDATRGSREPMIFPSGWELEKITIPPEDAQFLETQRYGVEEIARIFLGGFPELIGAAVTGGGSVTYANREQRMADFIALSLAPRYLVPFEAAMSALTPRGRTVKHNVDALLRADLKARYESYKLAAEVADMMGVPFVTVDEMRRFENLPKLTDAQRAEFTPQPRPATVIARDAEAFAERLAATARAAQPPTMAQETRNVPDMHFHLPESVQVEMRQEAPVVNVPAPIVNVPAPVVNITVEPTPVNVQVPPWPAPVVNVAAAEVRAPDVFVTVQQPAEGPSRKNVIRNAQGLIVAIEED